MGSGTLSKPLTDDAQTLIDFETIKSYTTTDVAAVITSFGAAYDGYGQAIVENGIDGRLLCELNEAEIPAIVQTLNVTNVIHIKKIELFFRTFKEKQAAVARSGDGQSSQTSGERRGSTKRVRRTSIGHSVEMQLSSTDAMAMLRTELASEATLGTSVSLDALTAPALPAAGLTNDIVAPTTSKAPPTTPEKPPSSSPSSRELVLCDSTSSLASVDQRPRAYDM
ncbi:Aste57867_20453 [Aphanomyces stellatus]|uniref:Aste57867_20453 protein n=1 Tax=Aphanomyces stellatus TaxID=120398 RepID=A0A485LF10_9STRA|nr:hypothetical protein As57867_020387 [Aphanomyces stellatus]VFT97139.1 Aste57867_20453 [Aphanomyces stellatus]